MKHPDARSVCSASQQPTPFLAYVEWFLALTYKLRTKPFLVPSSNGHSVGNKEGTHELNALPVPPHAAPIPD